jgi:hypothetical protein
MATNKLTYYVKSEYYDTEYIDKLFDKNIWIKVNDSDRPRYIAKNIPIDYIYLDGKYYWDPSNFKLTANIKNLVDEKKRSITSKNALMDNLSKIEDALKFIMPQLSVDLLNYKKPDFINSIKKFMKPNNIYIFKPVSGFAGQGIQMVSNITELIIYITKVIKTSGRLSEKQRYWVLQEYLLDPLLIKKPASSALYKFHIRHYLFYVPGKTSYYVYEGEVALARAPYVKGTWTNKLIHDTHFYGRDGELFPQILNLPSEQVSNIYRQIDELYGHVLKCIDAKCFSESKNCYELFGVDLILTHDYKLKVIEINEKLGMPSTLTPMSKILFEGCLNKIIMPTLNLKGSNEYNIHFLPIQDKILNNVQSTTLDLLTHKTKKEKI